MTILNISLCLPELDIIALQQTKAPHRSIVAVTERFIVPDKSFVLLPCRYSDELDRRLYRTQVLEALQPFVQPESTPIVASCWAQCMLCQQIANEVAVDAIAPRTIWTRDALIAHLQTRKKLFLSMLRVYALPSPMAVPVEPVCNQVYKFLPLPSFVNGEVRSPVLSDEDFANARQALLNPADSTPLEDEDTAAVDIVDLSDWVSKIAEVGNTSEGHDFEKLVRKGFLEIGFRNTQEKATASLDPKATGGAGGIDFYADYPYRVVGECKASKHDKINTDAATQVVRLGLQNLKEEDYLQCIKIVVSGASLTSKAAQIAKTHRINIIRPATMQRLVESKIDFAEDFDLYQLKSYLEAEPFGEAADAKINEYLDWCLSEWKEKQEHQQLIVQTTDSLIELSEQAIAHTSQAFSSVEIRAHHNAKYLPIITTSRVERILESQLYVADSRISKRQHQDGSKGYYLRPYEPEAS